MGFGREKTVYTYFAVASCSLFPHNSIMRLLIAKAAIIVTVADDFYDMEASLPELETLTLAVQRYVHVLSTTFSFSSRPIFVTVCFCVFLGGRVRDWREIARLSSTRLMSS